MSGWIERGRTVILVECYASPADGVDIDAAAARSHAACAALTAAGTSVEYLGALLVTADEVAFHLFAASEVEAVTEASRQAGLRVERVVHAVVLSAGRNPLSQATALSVGGELEGAIGHPSR